MLRLLGGTGSVCDVQARFDAEQLRTEGRSSEYVRISLH
jgi:hypothetical protein